MSAPLQMFEIRTSDPDRLRRIVAVGAGGLVCGLVLVAINLLAPLAAGSGYGPGNVAFGIFGVFAVVLATHPTYQAVRALEES